MPTLEDTVDFQAVTLNDILEVEAKSGVSLEAAEAGKYKLWFKISSVAAGLLAVLLVVALITGGDDGDGGGGGGGGKVLEAPAGTTPLPLAISPTQLPGGTKAGSIISVLNADGTVLASGATVLGVETTGKGINERTKLDLAVPDADANAVQTAEPSTLLFRPGTKEKAATTETTAPPPGSSGSGRAGSRPCPCPGAARACARSRPGGLTPGPTARARGPTRTVHRTPPESRRGSVHSSGRGTQ